VGVRSAAPTVLLPLATVAERTATSIAFWRKRIARGEIPIVRVGRCVRIREADLEGWLKRGRRAVVHE
jgi:excisionase family DNA binding protein